MYKQLNANIIARRESMNRINKLILNLCLSFLFFLTINVSYAGFLDDLKRQAEKAAIDKSKDILRGDTGKQAKNNSYNNKSNQAIQQSKKLDESDNLKQAPQSTRTLTFKITPQYKKLLTLLMQVRPESFNLGFMHDYNRFFIKGKTKECVESTNMRPDVGVGSNGNEFALRRYRKRLQLQLDSMLNKAKSLPQVSRTIIVKKESRIGEYDFKKNQYKLHYSFNITDGYRIDDAIAGMTSCAYERFLSENSALKIMLKPSYLTNFDIRGHIPIPMSESEAEAYSKKYRKMVDVKLTLIAQDELTDRDKAYGYNTFYHTLSVTLDRVRVFEKGTDIMLANYKVQRKQ